MPTERLLNTSHEPGPSGTGMYPMPEVVCPRTLLEAAELCEHTADPVSVAWYVLALQCSFPDLARDPDSLWATLTALDVLGNPVLEITELPDADLAEEQPSPVGSAR